MSYYTIERLCSVCMEPVRIRRNGWWICYGCDVMVLTPLIRYRWPTGSPPPVIQGV